MSLYEHVILSRPDISPAQVEELVENLTKRVQNLGGTVERTEYWGLRSLAYRVKKNRKAHYNMLQIDAAPSVIHEIERQHRISEDIIRYMSIRVDELSEDPSPIISKSESRKRRDKR
jgi:small subunit ribosomal protein S6